MTNCRRTRQHVLSARSLGRSWPRPPSVAGRVFVGRNGSWSRSGIGTSWYPTTMLAASVIEMLISGASDTSLPSALRHSPNTFWERVKIYLAQQRSSGALVTFLRLWRRIQMSWFTYLLTYTGDWSRAVLQAWSTTDWPQIQNGAKIVANVLQDNRSKCGITPADG